MADVVIVGAGPGGLAMAWRLERAGVDAVILEKTHRVASSWHGHYDSVRLFSSRRISSLPGMRIPRSAGQYPGKRALIEYFEAYARRLRTPIRFGVEVERIDREGDGYVVRTSAGEERAFAVVVATGAHAAPSRTQLPGQAEYRGRVVKPTEFRNGAPFRGQHVLIIGAGTTGTDIAFDLIHYGARVDVAVRTPPQVWPVKLFGVPMQYFNQPYKQDWFPDWLHDWLTKRFHRMYDLDLHKVGLPRARYGCAEMYEGAHGHALNFNRTGILAIKRGRIGVVAALDRFDGDEVLLADGTRLRPDVVIPATGRRPLLEPLVGQFGMLGPHGRPLVHGGRTWPGAPNLFFLGYRMPPAQLPDLRGDSRRACGKIVAGLAAREGAATGGRPPRRRPAAPAPPRWLRPLPSARPRRAHPAGRAPDRAAPAHPAR